MRQRQLAAVGPALERLDAQGRVVLPPELRRYAGIEREAIVVGMNTYIEIWEPARWEALTATVEDGFVDWGSCYHNTRKSDRRSGIHARMP